MNEEEQAKELVSLGSLSSVLKQKYKGTLIAEYGIKRSLKQLKFQPLKI
jgi:hypothetical protein